MMRRALWSLAIAAVSACGGDDGNTKMDAPPHVDASHVDASHIDAEHIDAAPATVKTVSCTGATIAATVTAPTFAYTSTPPGSASNNSEISVNGIIKFDLTTAADHPVGPALTGPTDPGLVAPTGAVTCLQFTVAGTFNYRCEVHGFTGSVTVSN